MAQFAEMVVRARWEAILKRCDTEESDGSRVRRNHKGEVLERVSVSSIQIGDRVFTKFNHQEGQVKAPGSASRSRSPLGASASSAATRPPARPKRN